MAVKSHFFATWVLLKNVLDGLVWAHKTLLNAGTYLMGPMPLNGVIKCLACVIITWYNRACQSHDNARQIMKTRSWVCLSLIK